VWAALAAALLGMALAQEQAPAAQDSAKPQVRVNYLNVCKPSDEEVKELKTALARVPGKLTFSGDFELTRGSTSLENAQPAKYVRLRKDVTGSSFATVQYSVSTDNQNTTETLVLRPREPKEMPVISLDDTTTSAAGAATAVVDADTPASRVKLERFGKSSVVLARCENVDQSAYEPLFKQASEILGDYRRMVGARGEFKNDFRWLTGARPAKSKTPAKPAAETSH
jgi:hypothetical protein